MSEDLKLAGMVLTALGLALWSISLALRLPDFMERRAFDASMRELAERHGGTAIPRTESIEGGIVIANSDAATREDIERELQRRVDALNAGH